MNKNIRSNCGLCLSWYKVTSKPNAAEPIGNKRQNLQMNPDMPQCYSGSAEPVPTPTGIHNANATNIKTWTRFYFAVISPNNKKQSSPPQTAWPLQLVWH